MGDGLHNIRIGKVCVLKHVALAGVVSTIIASSLFACGDLPAVYRGHNPPGTRIDESQTQVDEHTYYIRGPWDKWYKLCPPRRERSGPPRFEYRVPWWRQGDHDDGDDDDEDEKEGAATPSLKIRLGTGDWADEVSAESNRQENTLFLQIRNTGDAEGTFHFEGPASSSDWDLAYSREVTETQREKVAVEKTRCVPVTRYRTVKVKKKKWAPYWHKKGETRYRWEYCYVKVKKPYTEYVTETYTDYEWRTSTTTTTEDVGNEFDISLPAGETRLVTLSARENGVPENYFFGSFNLSSKTGKTRTERVKVLDHYEYRWPGGHGRGFLHPGRGWAFGRLLWWRWPGKRVRVPVYRWVTRTVTTGEGASDLVQANLVVPADASVQIVGDDSWNGEDVLTNTGDPLNTTQSTVKTVKSRESVVYYANIQNVENASASYILREHRGGNSAQIVRYYAGEEEITDELRSAQGYRTPILDPGEQVLVLVKVTPVGTDRDTQEIAISSRLDQIHTPSLDVASFSRFDAVKVGSRLGTITRIQVGGWEEEPNVLARVIR